MFTAFSFHWIISKLFSFFVTDPLLGSSFSLWLLPKMGSSDRLFNRQRTLHEILGGGQGIKFFFLITFYSMSLMVICVDQCCFFLCSFWYYLIQQWHGFMGCALFSFFVCFWYQCEKGQDQKNRMS